MDDSVKQRLVGAVVLASVAVIFFPSLFDEPDDRYIGGQSQIPAAPEIKPVQIAEPVRPEGLSPAPEPQAMYQLVEEEQASPAPKAAPELPATEPSQPAPGLNEQGVLRGWVLQVASFSDQAKAEDLQNRLIKAGHTAFIRPLVNSKGQQVVRVFVGPKAERQALVAIKAELDKSLKVNSLIREFKP